MAVSAAERILRIIPPAAVDQRPLICPCELDFGRQIDGETAIVIDHNAEGQPAVVNVEGTIMRLANSSPFRFACTAGEKVSGAWKGENVRLRIDLRVKGPGEESCWFNGTLHVERDGRRETRRVVGACGC
jgi:hypothetical protein